MATFSDIDLMEKGIAAPKDPGSIDPTKVDTTDFDPTEVDILKPHYNPTLKIIQTIYDRNKKITQEELIKQAKTQFSHTVTGDDQIPEDVLTAFVKYIVISSVLRNEPEHKITKEQREEAEHELNARLLEARLRHFSKGGKRKKRTRKRKIHKKKSHKKKSKTHRKKHHKKTHHKY
jgi:hypothetical protein